MASRSIDLAPTASIDLMGLNNKVVNMRQVVKRTKVQVINKLCKHISALKKKKGTDEQKAKNIRKAERFIEEIDSIKKLKEDKVSKYALANTISFKDVSKMSLLAGPRAMARLSDHPLLKKVVSDFREQHHDWRDLAAFLLVKQTGRRFKTKKQKQKKLSRCVENINASETMTKAYIQERFGKEGLTKAEQRFERKRRRPKSVSKMDAQDDGEGDNEGKRQKTVSDTNVESEKSVESSELQPERSVSKRPKDDSTKPDISSPDKIDGLVKIRDEQEVKQDIRHSEQESDSDGEESNNSESNESDNVSNENQVSSLNTAKLSKKSIDSSDSGSQSSDSETQISDVEEIPHVKLKKSVSGTGTEKVKAPKKNECVVKELNIEGDSGDNVAEVSESDSDSSSENESDSDTDSENELQKSTFADDSKDGDSSEEDIEKKVIKSSKKKKKETPEFLTRANKTTVSDPFFAGSDDEGTFEDSGVNEELDDNEDFMSDDELRSGKSKVESMFYNPHFSAKNERMKGSRFERDGGRGSSNRRRGFGAFDSRHRGRGMSRGRGGGRGGNFSDRARGSNFRGSGRGWTRHQDGNYGGGKFGNQDTSSHPSYNKRFEDRQASQPMKSFGAFENRGPSMDKGPKVDKGPQEKLHPSWEASKKRKAEQSGIVAFKGNKITFDDD